MGLTDIASSVNSPTNEAYQAAYTNAINQDVTPFATSGSYGYGNFTPTAEQTMGAYWGLANQTANQQAPQLQRVGINFGGATGDALPYAPPTGGGVTMGMEPTAAAQAAQDAYAASDAGPSVRSVANATSNLPLIGDGTLVTGPAPAAPPPTMTSGVYPGSGGATPAGAPPTTTPSSPTTGTGGSSNAGSGASSAAAPPPAIGISPTFHPQVTAPVAGTGGGSGGSSGGGSASSGAIDPSRIAGGLPGMDTGSTPTTHQHSYQPGGGSTFGTTAPINNPFATGSVTPGAVQASANALTASGSMPAPKTTAPVNGGGLTPSGSAPPVTPFSTVAPVQHIPASAITPSTVQAAQAPIVAANTNTSPFVKTIQGTKNPDGTMNWGTEGTPTGSSITPDRVQASAAALYDYNHPPAPTAPPPAATGSGEFGNPNYKQQEDTRGQSQDYLSRLESDMNGTAPSAAQAQLRQGLDASIAAQAAAAASAGPGNYAGALRTSMMGEANATQQAANQAAILKAQEYEGARTALGQGINSQRVNDLQATGMSYDNAVKQAQLEAGQATEQGELQVKQNALDQQGQLGLLGMGQSAAQSDLASRMHYEDLMAQKYANDKGLAQQASQFGQGESDKQTAAALQTIGTVASFAALASDRRLKSKVAKVGSKALRDMLSKLTPSEWDYKHPERHGEGRRIGVMAQDLEKSKLGKRLVRDTPGGKMVDMAQGLGATLAALADQSQRLDKLESGKRTMGAAA